MSIKNFGGTKEKVEPRTVDSLANLITLVDIRRVNPKGLAREAFEFLDSHGNSQLEDLSKSNLFALHLKTFVGDAKVDLHMEEVNRRFGNNHSREREDQLFRHLKNVKQILDLYSQVQKFPANDESALDIWIKMNSALTLKLYLEGTEVSALEYMGLEEEEGIYEKHAAQYRLIEVYSERMKAFGVESQIAHLWLDRFNRRLYQELCAPYLINTGQIKNVDEFGKYQRPHIAAILREAILDIAAERRDRDPNKIRF